MKKITMTLLATLITTIATYSQTYQTTIIDGEKVIINSDGQGEYVKVNNDTAKHNYLDCNKWITTQIDTVIGSTNVYAKNTLIVSNGDVSKRFSIFMMQSPKGGLILSIFVVGASSCIDERAKINILFTDGSRLELAHDGDFNCKSKVVVYFGDIFGKKNELQKLKSKNIQTMRIWTSDGYVQKNFTQENQINFFNVINCLTK